MRRRLLVAIVVGYASVVAVLVFGPRVLADRSAVAVTTCTGTLSRASAIAITVPSGAVCRITASTVNGSVIVQRDAYFEASGTAIHGGVRATGALTVFLHDGTSVSGSVLVDSTPQLFLYKATIGGIVRVTNAVAAGFGHVQVCETTAGQIAVSGSGPDVLVGDPPAGCPGNTVKSDVSITGNETMSELQVSGNQVAGSLYVRDNTGTSPKNVLNNKVQGTVDLSGNAVPFKAANN
jgi:hypothetical protein